MVGIIQRGRVWAAVATALLLPWMAITAPASADRQVSHDRRAERVDLQAVFSLAYSELIIANEREARRHDALAKRYAKSADDLRKQRARSDRIRELERLSELYAQLAAQNRTIVQQLDDARSGQAVQEAMLQVIRLERQLQEMTDEVPERSWLTFQEVAVLRKRGVAPPTGMPGILPFARRHWQGALR